MAGFSPSTGVSGISRKKLVISEVHPCGMQGGHPIPLTGLCLRDQKRRHGWGRGDVSEAHAGRQWSGIQCNLGRGESIVYVDPFKPHPEQSGTAGAPAPGTPQTAQSIPRCSSLNTAVVN